jgi:hypothetical protein
LAIGIIRLLAVTAGMKRLIQSQARPLLIEDINESECNAKVRQEVGLYSILRGTLFQYWTINYILINGS